MRRSAIFRMTPVSPCAPYPSIYSDQPTIPSSVVSLRNELTRHPASQCRSSILTIFMVYLARLLLHHLSRLNFRVAKSRILLKGLLHVSHKVMISRLDSPVQNKFL